MSEAPGTVASEMTRNPKPWLWACLLVSVAIAGAAGWLVWRAAATQRDALICNETFADSAWEQRWRSTEGRFAARDGALVSTGERGSFLYLDRRLDGNISIDYVAMMQPDQPPCDVSVSYALNDPFDATSTKRRFLIQVGAHDNSYAQILTPGGQAVSINPLMLEPGRRYRIRVEISGEVIRLWVDGAVICEHREMIPIGPGWLGFYAFYPGKHFDDVRILARGVAKQISPIAIGDTYSQDGDWDKAAAEYALIVATHGGTPLGDEARYRQGYALYRQGKQVEAMRLWQPLADSPWWGRVRLHDLEYRLERKAFTDIAIGIGQMFPQVDADVQQRCIALWTEAIHRASRTGMASIPELQALIAVRDQHFPNRGAPGAAQALLACGDVDGVLSRFPEQVHVASSALLAMGRAEDVLTRYADRRYHVAAALHDMGKLAEIQAIRPPMPWFVDYAKEDLLTDLGVFDQARARTRCNDPRESLFERVNLASRLGDSALALRILRGGGNDVAGSTVVLSTYLLAGARDDLLARYPSWATARSAAAYHEALTQLRSGGEIAPLVIEVEPHWYREKPLWCAELLIRPFIAWKAGDAQAMDAALARIATEHRWHFAQQPWHCAALIRGEIDATAFLQQPRRGNAPALLAFCQGLGAEVAGDLDAARRAYQTFLDLPAHRKPLHGLSRDPIVELFVAWRLEALP